MRIIIPATLLLVLILPASAQRKDAAFILRHCHVDRQGWIICDQPNDHLPPVCTDQNGNASRC